MSVLDRVQSAAESLTPSERRLVHAIVAKPRDVALGTATELARRSGVHEATVSRLARKLGFETYSHFRDAVRDEFIVRTDPAVRVRNTLRTARDGDVLADLVSREVEALAVVPDYITPERLRAAAEAIASARKVFIFATGNAETLATMMNRRLRRLALESDVLRGDGRDLAEQSVGMREGDVLLAFAFRRQPRMFAPLLRRARKVGARSVVVAGSVGPALSPVADHLLSAPRSGSPDAFQTLTVPMVVCNALVLATIQIDEKRSLKRLDELGELIEQFEGRS
jgi:DNA-binding MurR/RpiR family transcriptional regulator